MPRWLRIRGGPIDRKEPTDLSLQVILSGSSDAQLWQYFPGRRAPAWKNTYTDTTSAWQSWLDSTSPSADVFLQSAGGTLPCLCCFYAHMKESKHYCLQPAPSLAEKQTTNHNLFFSNLFPSQPMQLPLLLQPTKPILPQRFIEYNRHRI